MFLKEVFLCPICLAMILLPCLALADGVILRPLPGAFDLVEEESQNAFINYEKGVERLIIATETEEHNSGAFWIIPVPAEPQSIELDVLSSLPNLFGEDILKKAEKADLMSLLWFVVSNQIPPAAVLLVSFPGATSKGLAGEGEGVSIYSHLEKSGMSSEIITAKDEDALGNYLSAKGLSLKEGAIPILDEYIGKDYSFVVSWISSNAGEARGIYISFPTKQIYYPLMLTSVYEEKEIPIAIRILGHQKAKLSKGLDPFVETTYYTEGRFYSGVRCVSALSQLRTVFTYWEANKYRYPASLEELEKAEDSSRLMDEINRNCTSYRYEVNGAGDKYAMSVMLRPNKEWLINSEGFSGEKEISPPNEELVNFYGSSEAWKGTEDYTKIVIEAPAKLLAEDLWLKSARPAKVWVAKIILFLESLFERGELFSFLIYNAVLSFLVGGIVGLIFFRRFKKYAFVGLANLGTVITLMIVFYIVKRKTMEESAKRSLGTFSFAAVFSVFMILLTLLPILGLNFLLG